MLILIINVIAFALIFIGTIIGIILFGQSLSVGFLTIMASGVSGILFFALAAVLQYLERIADNTEYLLSRFQSDSTKRVSYPEKGKEQNKSSLEKLSQSAVERVSTHNWHD